MRDQFYPSDEYETPHEPTLSGAYGQRPDDIVDDATLSAAQKRAILASWASDARAVIDAPALRQLDNGDVVDIDTILDALKRLDGIPRERVLPFRPAGQGALQALSPSSPVRKMRATG